jgi:transcriptional regulator with XRE-family HTH domain
VQPEQSPAAGETIGERLKRLRLERGLSQRELAAPGVSYAYISRIEAGTRQPSVKALRRLAAKLGVTSDYLETGSSIDSGSARELRLADLELTIRLGGDAQAAEGSLRELVADADGAGDRVSARRARVALAAIEQERGAYSAAVKQFERALEGETFDPVALADIYGELAHAYSSAGRTHEAVALLERCLEELDDDDATLEARYGTLLSYALSDIGETARAEEVVQRLLDRMEESADPYMRVRLYWSMARLAHAEGREAAALANVRKAIALLQATDDTFHLARAHILAAYITVSREEPEAAELHLQKAERLLGSSAAKQEHFDITMQRARVAALQGDGDRAVELARGALALTDDSPYDRGLALVALAEGHALAGQADVALEAYAEAVGILEEQARWRQATTAARAWAKLLREAGRESEALDVLDRAADLGMRAVPESALADR